VKNRIIFFYIPKLNFNGMKKIGKGGGISFSKKWLLILCGALVGGVNGLFGGGGGMIAVPALTGIIKLSQKEAHATAILVILPVTAISAAVYLFNGNVNYSLFVPCVIGVAAGGAVGAGIMSKLSSPALIMIFAAVMLAAGLKSVFA